MSKKDQTGGTGWIFIYGLSFIFFLAILYSVFLYAFEGHIVPTIEGIANSTLPAAESAKVIDGIDKYLVYFKLMPFILFFVVLIYMIISTVYRQSGGS